MTNIEAPVIKIDGTPFNIGEKSIVELKLAPIGFVSLTEAATVAKIAARDGKVAKHFTRQRILRQVKAIDGTGQEIALDVPSLLAMPIPYAKKLPELINFDFSEAGEILQNGDGVTTPIRYKLGKPIEAEDGKGGKVTILELEFQASTYGDIEDVISEDGPLDQTVALINKCATPVGVSLMALPEWALNEIAVADGIFISGEILKSFLD